MGHTLPTFRCQQHFKKIAHYTLKPSSNSIGNDTQAVQVVCYYYLGPSLCYFCRLIVPLDSRITRVGHANWHWRSHPTARDWSVAISQVSHFDSPPQFLGVCLTIRRSKKCQVGIWAFERLLHVDIQSRLIRQILLFRSSSTFLAAPKNLFVQLFPPLYTSVICHVHPFKCKYYGVLYKYVPLMMNVSKHTRNVVIITYY